MTHSYATWLIHISHVQVTHSRVHVTYSYVQWLIQMYDITHSYARHDSLTPYCCVCIFPGDSFMFSKTHSYETWLIHMCAMTHPYARHDLFKPSCCVRMFSIHPFMCFSDTFICNMTRPYVWHDSSICETWLIHTLLLCTHVLHSSIHSFIHSSMCTSNLFICDMTQTYVWQDWCICLAYEWVMSYISYATWLRPTCDRTDAYARHDSFTPFFLCTHVLHSCIHSFIHSSTCTNNPFICAMTETYVWQDWCICERHASSTPCCCVRICSSVCCAREGPHFDVRAPVLM